MMEGLCFGLLALVVFLCTLMRVTFKPGCEECNVWRASVAEKREELRALRRGNRAEL